MAKFVGKQVFSNVVYFLSDVLSNARSSEGWTKQSINKAFYWADYCREVSEKSIQCSNTEEIDTCIKAIGIAIEGELTNVSLDYLKHSREILIKAFLENTNIKISVRQFVIDSGKEKDIDVDLLLQKHEEMKRLCDDIINVVHSSANSSSGQISAIKEIEAELLIERLRRRLGAHCSEQKAEEWIFQCLQGLCDCEKQIAVVLYTLLIEAKEIPFVLMLQKLFLTYLYQRISIGHELFNFTIAQKVWNQPPSLLCAVSEKHKQFCESYTMTLVTAGRLIKADSEKKPSEWEIRNEDHVPKFSFCEINEHFMCLCNGPYGTVESSQLLLSKLAQNSDESSIWKSLRNEIP